MSQSLAKVYVHIIFSTKHREKLITVSIKEELFSYIGGICKELECNPIIVGGHQDHIHILFHLQARCNTACYCLHLYSNYTNSCQADIQYLPL